MDTKFKDNENNINENYKKKLNYKVCRLRRFHNDGSRAELSLPELSSVWTAVEHETLVPNWEMLGCIYVQPRGTEVTTNSPK